MKKFKNTESISINTTQKDGRVMNNKVMEVAQKVTYALSNNSGQGALDSAVSILITIVLGALLLSGLYLLFGNVILPLIQERIMDMFNFSG